MLGGKKVCARNKNVFTSILMKYLKIDNEHLIFNENAMVILDMMIEKGKKVDMIFTDPPYKITPRGNGGNSGGMFQKKEVNNGKVFKENCLKIEDWLPKFYKVLKNDSHCYIMTNNKNITHYLEVIDKLLVVLSMFPLQYLALQFGHTLWNATYYFYLLLCHPFFVLL